MLRPSALAVLAVTTAVLVGGCTASARQQPTPASTSNQEVVVFAAASLTEPFSEIAQALSQESSSIRATYNFGGSGHLRAQIEQGAPADVFASANEKEMDGLARDGLLAGPPRIFASNRLVVIVPRANPGKVDTIGDLGRERLKVVLAAPTVPAGDYAIQMLDRMSADPTYGAGFKERVLNNVISQETDVKQVVAKIQLGEGDAGVVYVSDVTPRVSPDVREIDVPDRFNVLARYPIGTVSSGRQPDAARAFVDYVLSGEGQAVLGKHGFMSAK